ncbi:MAG: LysM peptidoglycan-binding domain-containing protein [Planctomycetota bacterium]|jgi:hypothetical protein
MVPLAFWEVNHLQFFWFCMAARPLLSEPPLDQCVCGYDCAFSTQIVSQQFRGGVKWLANTIIADRPLGIMPKVSPEVFLLKRVSEQSPEEAPPHLEDDRKAKQSGKYVVQEGDSLWRIASEQLGDGGRYKEISKLNADVLEDEDYLSVGMYLTMPVR